MSIFNDEFKTALKHLPEKEKDKLILRLLKKDMNLANRMLFELVDTKSAEDRREEIERHIVSRVAGLTKHFYSIAFFHVQIRFLSGDISEHVRITKDKYGDASLNLLLLIEVLRLNRDNIMTARPPRKLHKFSIAIIARVFKVLLLINKMDTDLLADFAEDLRTLAMLIGNNDKIMRSAINNGLDMNWLLHAELPENLVDIHKELKADGFLK